MGPTKPGGEFGAATSTVANRGRGPVPGIGAWRAGKGWRLSRQEGVSLHRNDEGPVLVDRAFGVGMAGTYSNRTDLLGDFADLRKLVKQSGPRRSIRREPRTSGGPKKQLTSEEAGTIVARYEAGTSMAQLKVEHHVAKRTVAKVLREAGVAIRPRGGQRRRLQDRRPCSAALQSRRCRRRPCSSRQRSRRQTESTARSPNRFEAHDLGRGGRL